MNNNKGRIKSLRKQISRVAWTQLQDGSIQGVRQLLRNLGSEDADFYLGTSLKRLKRIVGFIEFYYMGVTF